MFIETEDTPNPETLKFLPGRAVMGDAGTADFGDAASTEGSSELAGALFAQSDVRRVFLGNDFVSVTKQADAEWHTLKPVLLGILTEFFESNRPVFVEGKIAPAVDTAIPEEDSETVLRIRDLLDERVRPAVASDGGDIVFRGYRDGIVYLSMQGACSGCPSSRATLKHGVENMLRHYVPEVVAVEQVED
ncbi:nitrogen fixing thioredoxin-like protein NifU [Neokomagataea thailandica NBRC 106555]|uniref:NifU family protein n=2 Tax=Neokomagataea TaxID=1223423 RepID=A0A4Y6V507_9PROT|nr:MULTISPECIES: NifU family protein [Neokomagataea]QDH24434.1 NifU family protein [Neokomagataea tanensis]GBR50826.1 nitrogen fixing thioredoxin-like protein NifU [Neokomagataea thailandica NBRC 106555]